MRRRMRNVRRRLDGKPKTANRITTIGDYFCSAQESEKLLAVAAAGEDLSQHTIPRVNSPPGRSVDSARREAAEAATLVRD